MSAPDVAKLHKAAKVLRMLVATVLIDDANVTNWATAARSWLGGPVGDFCAAMSPAAALQLAELLSQLANGVVYVNGGIHDRYECPPGFHEAWRLADLIVATQPVDGPR